MTEIDRTDKFIVYRYDTSFEFIEHYENNMKYLIDSWNDEDMYLCASYDIAILGNKQEQFDPVFFILSNPIAWNNACKPYRENVADKVKQTTIHNKQLEIDGIYALMKIAVDFNDKTWFNDLIHRLNKINSD
jgi:hypothetical protein